MTRTLRQICVALLVASAVATGVGAQPAPYHKWRTLTTEHFVVHAPPSLEREGRIAAAAAEQAFTQLSRTLSPPRLPIQLVISDDADYSNGFASVFPDNRIVVFTAPPIQNSALRLNENWLGLVITHELTHLFHLDRSRGIWRLGQQVFGRAPFLFPNAYGPAWLTEGLAVYEESRLTTGGRLNDSEHQMLARAGALEGKLFRIDELSLGTSRFPGGQGAYAYGSLFVDYLARAHGDSSIRRFIDAQSALLVPYWIDYAAKASFGRSFTRAFASWRDSVQRSAGTLRPPLPGWRELTAHGYFAIAPRWLNDSTLVYTGGDGRETNAAYRVSTTGARTRIGRRNSREGNAPLGDGSLVFAQIDLTTPEEVRSDLYRSRGSDETRLTHGQRLIQPDVRRDGAIVAVQIAPTRSDLVLLDANARSQHLLRAATTDETWSEPRWSPDGRRVAAVHRRSGGQYSIEVIDVASAAATIIAEGAHLLSSPSWSPDGSTLLYVSEENRTPQIIFHREATAARAASEWRAPASQTGLSTPELSPNGRLLAAVTLRADGYHIGVAPVDSIVWSAVPTRSARPELPSEQAVAGEFTRYSPWASLRPRYWYPMIEQAPARGTRLGASTSGSDVVGRHAYSAYLAIPTTGKHPIAGVGYRYAGLRRPLFDLSASQNYQAERELLSGGTTQFVGTLLKRTRDASLTATFVRPRVRSNASVTFGGGVENRAFLTEPSEFLPQLDTAYGRQYTFPRLLVGASWSNLQRPALSISQEDGVAVAFTVRERWRADRGPDTRSTSAVGTAAGFKSLDLPGFAHHVVAMRIAGGLADRRAGTSLEVGGTSGTSVDLLPGYSVGEGRRTFGVRGFATASTYGTRAAAATVEYRAPLVLAARGIGLLPLYLDRSSLSLFADGGVATCARNPLYSSICVPAPRIGRPIASVGVELGLSASVITWDAAQAMRFGLAVPVIGRALVGARAVSPYLAFGLSF